MRLLAKLYAGAVVSLGALALVQASLAWGLTSWFRWAAYLVLATVGSSLKVTLPGVRSTMSLSFCIVLIAIEQLSLGETVAIAACAFVFQSLWRSRTRPRIVQLSFNLATAVLAASSAWQTFHWTWLRNQGVEFPLLMAAAACVYFLANTIPVATIIALTEGKRIGVVWRDCYLWTFPYYLLGAVLAGAFDWGSKTAGWQVAILGLPSMYFIYNSYDKYLKRLEAEKQRAEERSRYAESISNLHLRTIEALALAIEAKDQATHDHLQRVQVYALGIGRELGLTALEMEALRAAALLHDIGKLAVPEQIISKPGKLTPEELEKMKIHPIVGAEILEHVGFPYPVVPIVRCHHEKWDGSGYPDGLAGEAIPIGARILAAVDCLDAMSTDRPYRKAHSLQEALAYVEAQAGESFDPAVVRILASRFLELESKAQVKDIEGRYLADDVGVPHVPGGVGNAAVAGHTQKPAAEFVERIGAARQEAQLLFEMTRDIGNSLSLETTISVLAAGLTKLAPSDSIAVFLCQDGMAKCQFAKGEDENLLSTLEIPLGHGLSGWVVQEGRPLVNANPAAEFGHLSGQAQFTKLRSALSVPLEGVGGIMGALTLYSTQKDAFTRDHLRIVQAISSRLGITIENTLKYRQAEDEAVLDFLTELPNARALFLRLQELVYESAQQKTPLTVMIGDLDGFKGVNDRLGHLTGNRVLQAVASGLRKECRDTDYAARMGGDEFAIIVAGVKAENIGAVVERYRKAADQAAGMIIGHRSVSLSLGVATLGIDGEHPEELLAAADRRMYRDKLLHKQRSPEILELAGAVGGQPAAETVR